jgi:hypothetical protein
MKINLFLALFCTSLLFSCSVSREGGDCGSSYGPPYHSKSYIQWFMNAEILHVTPAIGGFKVDEIKKVVYFNYATNPLSPEGRIPTISDCIRLCIYLGDTEITRYCHYRYYSHSNAEPCLEQAIQYEALTTEIGDTSFNRDIHFFDLDSYRMAWAIPEKIKSVIITSDKDFKDGYPAGSNLNNLFTIYFNDAYAVVRNNYRPIVGTYQYPTNECIKNYPYAVFKEKLSAVNFPERPYIDYRWDCILDVAPQYTDTYTFYVKVVLEDGTVLEESASFTIRGVE